MTCLTTLGVTVSPEISGYFLRFLRSLSYERPDTVTQCDDGAVNAIWENRNRFAESSDYRSILDFLDNMGSENYIYESVTEDDEPEIGGGYMFRFARVTRYEVEGEPVDPDNIVSPNRKPRGFFRRHREWLRNTRRSAPNT